MKSNAQRSSSEDIELVNLLNSSTADRSVNLPWTARFRAGLRGGFDVLELSVYVLDVTERGEDEQEEVREQEEPG